MLFKLLSDNALSFQGVPATLYCTLSTMAYDHIIKNGVIMHLQEENLYVAVTRVNKQFKVFHIIFSMGVVPATLTFK